MNALLEQYLAETRECLDAINPLILRLERDPTDDAAVGELFRLVHTLKGNSGLFEFAEIIRVLHAAEDLLDQVRGRVTEYSSRLADRLLEAIDFVERSTSGIADNPEAAPGDPVEAKAIADALRALMGTPGGAGDDAGPAAGPTIATEWLNALPPAARDATRSATAAGARVHAVTYIPDAGCFYRGEDPFFTIRQLPEIIWCDIAAPTPLPPVDEIDAFACSLAFRCLSTATVDDLLRRLRYVSDQVAITELADTDRSAAPSARATRDEPVASLRVEQRRIDRLMDLIGEMTVSKNALPYLAARADAGASPRDIARDIKAQYAVIHRITQALQDAIMQVRMMPIGTVLARFPRLVRDTSAKLGKQVKLVLEGEHTEADKTVMEALADPLIHIVRNSLDHGLEMPADRVASGKTACGTIAITAQQDSGRVLLRIRDDGRGIDPVAIRRKAVAKGVITAEEAGSIDDREAINLIFTPGFSTSDTISDLSGRGVGMDVVRSAIEKVRGTIRLDSVVGQGTSIEISLPLAMAVTSVVLIETDGQLFGVPVENVIETVRIAREAIHGFGSVRTISLRGRILPIKELNGLLGLPAVPRANAQGELAVLVATIGGRPVGIVVDDFRGTAEVVQKPHAGVLAAISAFSGSAVMGDGSVLMVLDLAELF